MVNYGAGVTADRGGMGRNRVGRRVAVAPYRRRMTPAPCTREDHVEWLVILHEGRPHAIACAGCMATVAAPDLEVEPGVRQVELPAGWEDED